MAGRREQALQECLELLRQGLTLEECLTRYPEDAAELEPLLRTAQVARSKNTTGCPMRSYRLRQTSSGTRAPCTCGIPGRFDV